MIQNKIVIANELRPCIVNGCPALFHTWAEREGIIIKAARHLTVGEMKDLKATIELYGVIPCGIAAEKQKETFALVEYEDGQIAEVKPSAVRFIDNAHNDYIFTEGTQ